MKIVLDTNVLVSGVFWGGIPLRVLDLWRLSKVEVLMSDEILDEYLKTIRYIARQIRKLDLYDEWSALIPAKATLVLVKKSFQLCRDPEDNKFLDCAISGKARCIVSGDHDLLILKKILNVDIFSPRNFIKEFRI